MHKRRIALLLPAHNEELLIQTTIKSAVDAGQDIQDIYVVDDFSVDSTREKAVELLGESRVLSLERQAGKAMAVKTAIEHFALIGMYSWIHIADADCVFGKNYFQIYRENLNDEKYCVVIGFVQSLHGNWISKYRAFSYTFGQHIYRRLQSYAGMVSVFPGPVTCFRSDIVGELEFDVNSLTEDFDITLQVHRKKLGRIKFIPEAVCYTQDPQTLGDFYRQSLRWMRGFFQGILRHKIGRRAQRIDVAITYQLLEAGLYLTQLFILLPLALIISGNWRILPVIFVLDYLLVAMLGVFSAVMAKRISILHTLPYFYFLRFVELFAFVKAFTEVVVLRRFRITAKGWETVGRRYDLSVKAMKDIV